MNNYFIIEKEGVWLEHIKMILSNYPGLHCIGHSSDADSAMNTILKETPNLVFISVDNVIVDPFNFVNELSKYMINSPVFIAISEGKEKSFDAIKSNFFDYLLKPMCELDTRKTILKFNKSCVEESKYKICIKSYKDYKYINTDEILFLKADNNTTDFYMKEGHTICAYKTLKTYENLLPSNFLRIHKSYIINSSYVFGINYGKSICTINKCTFNIPFTKTYIDNVENINKELSQSSRASLN